MTESQQIEFNKIKNRVDESSITLTEVHRKTDVIYFALVGNDLTKDGGLVKQINDMEINQKGFEKDIRNEISKVKVDLELRISKLESTINKWKGIAFGLFVAGSAIGFLVQYIITHLKN